MPPDSIADRAAPRASARPQPAVTKPHPWQRPGRHWAILWLGTTGLATAIALGIGAKFARYADLSGMAPTTVTGLINSIRLVEQVHADSLSFDSLGPMALSSLLYGLDPYSHYNSPMGQRITEQDRSESHSGLGFEVEWLDSVPIVVYVMQDGPAEAAGVRVGDSLLAVLGRPTKGYIYDDESLQGLLRGPINSTTQLTVGRPGGQTSLEAVFGEQPTYPEVVAMRWPDKDGLGKLAILRITQFDEGTTEQASSLIGGLLQDGVTHVVLDLRGNPGGYVEEALRLASLFLKEGDIFCTTRGKFDGERTLSISSMGAYQGLKLTALVDSNTASAAELFAGTLRCHKRLTLMGTATYGKSEILEDFMLQDGSSMTLVIARNYLPDGTRVDRQPIPATGGARVMKPKAVFARGLQPDRPLQSMQALPASGQELVDAAVAASALVSGTGKLTKRASGISLLAAYPTPLDFGANYKLPKSVQPSRALSNQGLSAGTYREYVVEQMARQLYGADGEIVARLLHDDGLKEALRILAQEK